MGGGCIASRLSTVHLGRRHAGSKWHPHRFSLYPSTVNPVGKNRTTRSRARCLTTTATLGDKAEESSQQQLNLSVLRFTLGIPGLDESYLPRWLGLAFGSLILLNHFFGSFDSPSPAQLRSETLGICLAVFSAALPFLGKFLKGTSSVDRSILPEGNKQIFVMSEKLSDIQKEDLAWGSYVMLRNTNTMAVLISVQGVLCVRGYWNTPEDASEVQVLDWFRRQIQQFGFSDLKESLYFPIAIDSQLGDLLPKGTLSLLLEPVLGVSDPNDDEMVKFEGFVMLASSANYAYRDKDRAWIKAVSNKFRGLRGTSLNDSTS